MRAAIDTGGTFTDLVLETEPGTVRLYKSPTTPENPIDGITDVLAKAAEDLDMTTHGLLADIDPFIHATTRALNAILTETVGRTALLTTKGHPDILLYREGGKTDPFNFDREYPAPYIPRALTFQVPERIDAGGRIVLPIDRNAVQHIVRSLKRLEVEAVAVTLLWSVLNPTHEQIVAEILEQEIPGIPYTLSHQLNPTVREYRRMSSTAIDASLKPIMAPYLSALDSALDSAGFKGRPLMMTSSAGVLDAADVAAAPIHAVQSGPAAAPVAGRAYSIDLGAGDTVIVTDSGGTSYDVSMVRNGRIPTTRETWLGGLYSGHITGFPSVEVKSIGAGGGSIASVDDGGLLHVGPQSAGADPGPACYARGGSFPTVTDAALLVGYLDHEYFLGGDMRLDIAAAKAAMNSHVAESLNLSTQDAANSVLRLAVEHMAAAIEEISLNYGLDVRGSSVVAGGGSGGLLANAIGKRLGANSVVVPNTAAALSAAGILMSNLEAEYSETHFQTTGSFERQEVNAVLETLEHRCRSFIEGPGKSSLNSSIEFIAEARYPSQVWEIATPMSMRRFNSPDDVVRFKSDFHSAHEELFAVNDLASEVEIVTWRARVSCQLRPDQVPKIDRADQARSISNRSVFFSELGEVATPVIPISQMDPTVEIHGPAIIETPVTTVVIHPGSSVISTESASLLIKLEESKEST